MRGKKDSVILKKSVFKKGVLILAKKLPLALSSDIRGIAVATADYAANLTPIEMQDIAAGLIHFLLKSESLPDKRARKLRVGVGRDSRISGPALKASLIAALQEQGVDVIDFDLATTPAMFMSTQFKQFDCDAGVMLTASHLPYYYNGIKIFTKNGGVEEEDIRYIMSHTKKRISDSTGNYQKADLISAYSIDLVEKIKHATKKFGNKPLTGWHIIVDAGNGAGGFFAKKVLQVLGANTNGSQFLEPDGRFPNHIPNPDNKQAMVSIQNAVLTQKADLGVIFDTDVDRAALVGPDGSVLNRNNLIALLSKIVLTQYPGATIVTNSPTSDHLKDFIVSQGGQQVRYISGYRNVINKMIALNKEGIETQLAIETSGHAAFKENYNLDDGAYLVAKVLMILPQLKAQGQTINDLLHELKQPSETLEIRLKINEADFKDYGQKIISELKSANFIGFKEDLENEEGVRMKLNEPYGSGWFLLRLSLHEPLLVLQLENDEVGMIDKVLPVLREFFETFSALELAPLDKK